MPVALNSTVHTEGMNVCTRFIPSFLLLAEEKGLQLVSLSSLKMVIQCLSTLQDMDEIDERGYELNLNRDIKRNYTQYHAPEKHNYTKCRLNDV